ncbi:fasciclin domain-containing protein [Streptomyces xanthophaeus]|uniref:fasciclin domain-containing protein n=1 Tax=Streptomyces xanthophaeus TaxID=67385 RepID=UPI00068AAFEF
MFAPTDEAIPKILKADLDKILADKPELTKILTHHVVGELDEGFLQDLEGGSLTTAGSGESLTVDGTAKIVCGGVQAANATVNSIDATVEPM